MFTVPGNIVFVNGEQRMVSDISPSEYSKYRSVYEVIRISGKCPLFLEDHIERLKQSCIKSGCGLLVPEAEIISMIKSLIELSGLSEGNIRLSYNYYRNEKFSMLHFIESSYPSVEDYSEGIDTVLYRGERDNPSVKIYNQDLRASVNRLLTTTGAREALLVDTKGDITEGSKSNVFFVKDRTIYTSPESRVLSGITRKYVLDIINSSLYNLEYKMVNVNNLADFDAAFISGTSPMILPIRSIDKFSFSSHNAIVNELMEKYTNLVNSYLADQRD